MENVVASKIIASCIVHATEDVEKVKVALTNIFPEEIRGDISIKEQKFEGHYGNPIIILGAEASDKKIVEIFLENFSKILDKSEKSELSREFMNYLDDKGNLFIRFDKQSAFKNKFHLQQQDPIKIIIKIKKSKRLPKDSIFEYFQRIGILA